MSVKVLIDMNLSPDWVAVLQRHGWPAIHWGTEYAQMVDGGSGRASLSAPSKFSRGRAIAGASPARARHGPLPTARRSAKYSRALSTSGTLLLLRYAAKARFAWQRSGDLRGALSLAGGQRLSGEQHR